MSQFNQKNISITPQNIDAFIKAYTVSIESHNNVLCTSIAFNNINDIILINNFINIITTQFIVLETLVIFDCMITVLPDSIEKLTKLTTLTLYKFANLTVLPVSIGNLTQLTKLDLYGCKALTILPESIGKLTQLKALSLGDCTKLTELPKTIGNLTQLINLALFNCKVLTILPESIGKLTKLTSLDLQSCASLTVLPEEIGNLTQLEYLHLGQCASLINLPDVIGKLTKLKTLSLLGCKALTILPDTIAQLTQLSMIFINDCNSLSQLPTNLWLLTHLKYLCMDDKHKYIITNWEILYLLPLVTINNADATTYLAKIENAPIESIYNKPIKNFVMPFNEYNVENVATPEQNKLPYSLDPDKSIQQQIGIFIELRTRLKSILQYYK